MQFALDFMLSQGKRYLGELSLGEAMGIITDLVGECHKDNRVLFEPYISM